jgi:hypothetical protein
LLDKPKRRLASLPIGDFFALFEDDLEEILERVDALFFEYSV